MAAQTTAVPAERNMLERYFKVTEAGSTIGTEVRGGLTNFLVMSYILVVNAVILSNAGMPFPAVAAATALMAALFTGGMALWANYPYTGAAGLGINAVVAFGLVKGAGLSWQAAMGVVTLEGAAVCVAMALGLRRALMDAVPYQLKLGIGAGIGAFIFAIGVFNGGFAIGTGNPADPVSLGNFNTGTIIVTIAGLVITSALYARGVKGALLLGIIGATIVGVLVNAATGGAEYKALPGVAVMPANLLDTPDFSTIGQGLNFGVFAKLGVITAVLTIFSLMLSDFFDTVGTVTSVAAEGGWLNKDGTIPRANRIFWVDSLGALFGGIFGTSSNTTYIESGAGVAEGARTGLASLVTAILFLLAIFLAPIAGIVPPQATSAALMLVGWFMFKPLLDLNKTGDIDFATGFAILLTVFVMPLTYLRFLVVSETRLEAPRGWLPCRTSNELGAYVHGQPARSDLAAGPPLLLISVRPGLRGTTRSSVTPMIGACADGQLPDVSETTRNFTYSITNGIGAGFLAYTFLKLVSGKTKDVSLPMWFAALAFLIYFADPLIRKFLG